MDDGTVLDVKKLNGGSALLNVSAWEWQCPDLPARPPSLNLFSPTPIQGKLPKTKHWARIFHTQPSEEIAEDMDKSFNNLGLVLALLLTMAMPVSERRRVRENTFASNWEPPLTRVPSLTHQGRNRS